jgi:hypothetical protein
VVTLVSTQEGMDRLGREGMEGGGGMRTAGGTRASVGCGCSWVCWQLLSRQGLFGAGSSPSPLPPPGEVIVGGGDERFLESEARSGV